MRVSFAGPLEWNETAKAGLANTFRDSAGEYFAERGVRTKRLELWRVYIDVDSAGYLVTEHCGTELFVWAYEGRGAFTMVRALIAQAQARGMEYVGWLSMHKGFRRLFARMRPEITPTAIPGEMRFKVKV
jgi:hypothetical protein